MAQLVSVRSNQDFGLNYKTGKLIPQTEVIILVEVSKYQYDKTGDKIARKPGVEELRFKVGTEGLNHLIGQLQQAERMASSFEQMAGALNEIIVNSKPKDDKKTGL